MVHRRNISPAPLLFVPTLRRRGGRIPGPGDHRAGVLHGGRPVRGRTQRRTTARHCSHDFLPSFVVFILAVTLGEVVRSRRALAAETARRLGLADRGTRSEAARRVAEERLRIARELHDTVAHSMATITVQAGSALHVLVRGARRRGTRGAGHDQGDEQERARRDARVDARPAQGRRRGRRGRRSPAARRRRLAPSGLGLGLERLRHCAPRYRGGLAGPRQRRGRAGPLPPEVDHAAYRILQESLTNVLRHAGPRHRGRGVPAVRAGQRDDQRRRTTAAVRRLRPAGGRTGARMRERATAAGGDLRRVPALEDGCPRHGETPEAGGPAAAALRACRAPGVRTAARTGATGRDGRTAHPGAARRRPGTAAGRVQDAAGFGAGHRRSSPRPPTGARPSPWPASTARTWC